MRVEVNLATGLASGGHAQGDVLNGIHHLTGSAFRDRLTGSSEDNKILGGDGADRISGGTGLDQVWGGSGDDVFVFSQYDHLSSVPLNYEVIGDFTAGGSEDAIDLVFAGTGFRSLNDVLAHSTQVQIGSDFGTFIDLGPSGEVYLANVRMADLTSSDFIFT